MVLHDDRPSGRIATLFPVDVESKSGIEQLVDGVQIRLFLKLLYKASDQRRRLISEVICHLCPVELPPTMVDIIECILWDSGLD